MLEVFAMAASAAQLSLVRSAAIALASRLYLINPAEPTVAVISNLISKMSAGVLFVGGALLLFASDTVLPLFAADLQPSATWPGELVGAGWLALAALNWLSRGIVLGGVYGRPVVIANVVLYFVTAMVLLRTAADRSGPGVLWLIGVVTLLLAAIYGWLLLRGPFQRDMSVHAQPTSFGTTA